MYGTTYGGGTNGGYGSVFKISTNGAFTSLYSFGSVLDNGFPLDGANPAAALVQGSDGYFYGTTENGGVTNYNFYDGTYGYGTVFKISTNGALTSLYSFTGTNDGANPVAALVQDNDGNFYGTTCYGGNTNLNYGSGYGTVFKITKNGGLTNLYSFGSVLDTNGYALDDGAHPRAGLAQGRDGNFYGTTSPKTSELDVVTGGTHFVV